MTETSPETRHASIATPSAMASGDRLPAAIGELSPFPTDFVTARRLRDRAKKLRLTAAQADEVEAVGNLTAQARALEDQIRAAGYSL